VTEEFGPRFAFLAMLWAWARASCRNFHFSANPKIRERYEPVWRTIVPFLILFSTNAFELATVVLNDVSKARGSPRDRINSQGGRFVKILLSGFMVLLFLTSSLRAGFAADSTPAKSAAPESGKNAADKKPPDKKAKSTGAAKPQRLKGEITALDVKAGTVSVKSASEEKSFVTQDAAKDTLEILKIGEQVKVTYSEKDKRLVATSLRRIKPKTASAETKTKKPSKTSVPSTKESAGSK
jgi:hypothetical protein